MAFLQHFKFVNLWFHFFLMSQQVTSKEKSPLVVKPACFLSNRFKCNATTAREVYESLFVCLEARPIVYFLSVILRSRVAQLMKKLHLTFLSSLYQCALGSQPL